MTWGIATVFLTQQRASCIICYGMRRRYAGDPSKAEIHPSMLVGGTAAGMPQVKYNSSAYKRNVVSNLERHLRTEHRDHPMVLRFAPELASAT